MSILLRILKFIGVIAAILLIAAGIFYFKYVKPVMGKLHATTEMRYDKNLTLVFGGGGNSGIFDSDSLVVVIDTKMDEAAETFYQQAKKIAGNKPIIVINTHFHPDHIGGNKFYTGSTIIAGGNYTEAQWKKEASKDGIPTQWLKNIMEIPMGEDTLTILNLSFNAHTESDILVYSHQRKMLFTGDVVLNKHNPVLMGKADLNGYFKAFDLIKNTIDVKTIIPGHGEAGGLEMMEEFRKYFEDMNRASLSPSERESLVAKYHDWPQIPYFMSPGTTISYFEKTVNK